MKKKNMAIIAASAAAGITLAVIGRTKARKNLYKNRFNEGADVVSIDGDTKYCTNKICIVTNGLLTLDQVQELELLTGGKCLASKYEDGDSYSTFILPDARTLDEIDFLADDIESAFSWVHLAERICAPDDAKVDCFA